MQHYIVKISNLIRWTLCKYVELRQWYLHTLQIEDRYGGVQEELMELYVTCSFSDELAIPEIAPPTLQLYWVELNNNWIQVELNWVELNKNWIQVELNKIK